MRDIIEDGSGRRAFFFRDQYRNLVVVCFVLLTLTSSALAYVYYQARVEQPSATYASTSIGDLIRLMPAESTAQATVAMPAIIHSDT